MATSKKSRTTNTIKIAVIGLVGTIVLALATFAGPVIAELVKKEPSAIPVIITVVPTIPSATNTIQISPTFLTTAAVGVEPEKSLISINHILTKVGYYDLGKDPVCSSSTKTSQWDTEFIAVFDIQNRSDKNIYLSDINVQDRLNVLVKMKHVTAYVWLDFFRNKNEVQNWVKERPGPEDIKFEISLDKSIAAGPPIELVPGRMIRYLIRGKEQVIFDEMLDAQEIHDQVRANGDWFAAATFSFSDGTVENLTFTVPHPYLGWEPTNVMVPTVEPCSH